MPDAGVHFDYESAETVANLFKVGEDEKALELAILLGDRADENLACF